MAEGPTPDFDRVTLKWAGVTLDGSPVTGHLELTYSRDAPLLDESPDMPIAIYPTTISQDLGQKTVQVNGNDTSVGYAEFDVPASDDPDILGTGGTYTLVEKLDNARGQTRTFIASKDTAGGVIWLNRLTSVAPVPGETQTAISIAEFEALKALVQALPAFLTIPSVTSSTAAAAADPEAALSTPSVTRS